MKKTILVVGILFFTLKLNAQNLDAKHTIRFGLGSHMPVALIHSCFTLDIPLKVSDSYSTQIQLPLGKHISFGTGMEFYRAFESNSRTSLSVFRGEEKQILTFNTPREVTSIYRSIEIPFFLNLHAGKKLYAQISAGVRTGFGLSSKTIVKPNRDGSNSTLDKRITSVNPLHFGHLRPARLRPMLEIGLGYRFKNMHSIQVSAYSKELLSAGFYSQIFTRGIRVDIGIPLSYVITYLGTTE